METMIKMRDTLRELADIVDEIIVLDGREKAGEDVEADSEAVLGRFLIKMIELNSLQA